MLQIKKNEVSSYTPVVGPFDKDGDKVRRHLQYDDDEDELSDDGYKKGKTFGKWSKPEMKKKTEDPKARNKRLNITEPDYSSRPKNRTYGKWS